MGRSSHVSILFHGLGVGHRAIGLRDGPYHGGHAAITRLGSLEVPGWATARSGLSERW